MEAQKFPLFPRLIGLVCLALGLIGLGGDIYTFTQPAALAAAPAWAHIVSVFVDLLFLAGGVGVMLRKKRLYLLAMGACIVCSAYTAISYPFMHWERLIAASGHQLSEQAISAGVFVAKSMTIVMGVLLPIAFLAILGFYYRRINPDTWR